VLRSGVAFVVCYEVLAFEIRISLLSLLFEVLYQK
jgi:hypothetical protein